MATLIGCRFFRKSWSARLPTPSSHTRHQSPLRFSEKRGRSRSYLSLSPTRWARVSSPACPAQAAISPASSTQRARLPASCWSYSWRLRPALSGPRSCSIPTLRPAADHIICLPSRRRPDCSDWSRSQHQFVTTPKSKRSSPPSDVRMAAVSSLCPTASCWFIDFQSFCKQLEIRYRQSIGTPSSLETEACSLADLTPATYFDAPPLTSIASSVAQSQASYRFNCRLSSNW